LKKITDLQAEIFKPNSDEVTLGMDLKNCKIDLLILQLEIMREEKDISKRPKVEDYRNKPKNTYIKDIEIFEESDKWRRTIKKLESLRKQDIIPLAFFDWRLDFPEVMNPKVNKDAGFDIVIGNPPYVEAKKLKEIAVSLKNYEVYVGTSDLSSYFFERGINLCNSNGHLCFINTNKFFNTGYGKKVRSFLLDRNIKQILNFEQVEVFEGILVSSLIILIQNELNNKNQNILFKEFYKLRYKEFIPQFQKGINDLQEYKKEYLTEDEWSFADEKSFSLKAKIDKLSDEIVNFDGIEIYRGITTGFNPAFIISNEEKVEFIRNDANNQKVIKPMLQGRNIRKWIYNVSPDSILQTGFDTNIEDNYPQIYEHLKQFEEELKKRSDQGLKWWNLRSCSYYDKF